MGRFPYTSSYVCKSRGLQDFEVQLYYKNLLFKFIVSSLEWHTGSVHCIAHVFIMSLNKNLAFYFEFIHIVCNIPMYLPLPGLSCTRACLWPTRCYRVVSSTSAPCVRQRPGVSPASGPARALSAWYDWTSQPPWRWMSSRTCRWTSVPTPGRSWRPWGTRSLKLHGNLVL